jgi:hypothetical protein
VSRKFTEIFCDITYKINIYKNIILRIGICMRRNFWCCAVLSGLFFINGCTINSAKRLPVGDLASEERAVVVYGVKVEGFWNYPGFNVQLAEYDVKAQRITGNCFRFNRTEAVVPVASGEVKYFAFDVPPGHYVYSPFNGARLAGEVFSFEATAGQSVYVGEFIYGESQSVMLRRNLDDTKSAIDKALPGLRGNISLANAMLAKAPHIFMCTP